MERQDRQARRADSLTALIETDAVVVGAGPVGLYQVFQLGLHELRTHLIDSLPALGGQCIALYPDKPIYDIPALPVASARELVERLARQIEPFGVTPHLNQQLDTLAPRDDGRFELATSAGTRFVAKTVVVAGGVGSFQPRRLKVDGIDAHEGQQLFYGADDLAPFARRRVLVVGDADEALDAANRLAELGAAVTLMHRRDEFKARPDAIERMHALRASGALRFIAAQPTGLVERDGRLAALQVLGADEQTHTLELDVLLALTGLSPKLGPIAQWGLNLERKQIAVDTERFETSTRGIFAVGDIVTYPGKRKLIVSGFHEATLAAFAAAAHVHPDRAIHLEYTTTSPRLHRVLGVGG